MQEMCQRESQSPQSRKENYVMEQPMQKMTDERAARLEMNTEAVRAGLFASATDIAEMMKENGVEDASAAILTGAIMFAVELWDNTMARAGHPPMKRRKALLANVAVAFATARAKVQE